MNSTLFQKNAHRAKPDASWTSLLENSAREVFEIMLGTEISALPPASDGPSGSVMAVVGLAGQLSGVFSMNFTVEGAERATKKMLGVKDLKPRQEVHDAVGKICNMVAGNFKAKVSSLADGCLLSVPIVITGNDFQCHTLTDGESFQVKLKFDNQPLWVILDLSS